MGWRRFKRLVADLAELVFMGAVVVLAWAFAALAALAGLGLLAAIVAGSFWIVLQVIGAVL